MNNNRKKVLLCTGVSSETDNNENQYRKYMTENDLECEILQVLHFEFVNLDELRKRLVNVESYEGLILTSPRAAAAIAMAKMENPFSIEQWIQKPTFCVGQATEFVAKEQLGLVNVKGANSGNAKNLANFIADTLKGKNNQPLLLPCSDIARDTIPKILSEQQIPVQKIIVYKTQAHKHLKEILTKALKNSPDVLVFFSPSIVNYIVEVLNNDKNVLGNFKIVAIGPVTEQALIDIGIAVHGVSEKPEPKSLTEVIKKII